MAAPAALTIQPVAAFGGKINTISWTAGSTDGHYIVNQGGDVLLLVKNTDSSGHDVVITSVADEFGCTGDVTVTCAATSGHSIAGPFPPHLFSDSSGHVGITIATATGLSLAAIQIAK
jgi:hypothetical protein